jgi:uncharacterized protein
VFACLAVLCAGLSGCHEQAAAPPNPRTIRLGVGSRGGDFDVMGRVLAQALQSEQPAYSVEIVSNEGAVGILDSLEQGKCDCGFSYANVAYEAYVERAAGGEGSSSPLRGVALVDITPLHFVVGRTTAIKAVPDLRGHSLAVGPSGSGSYRAAILVLDAFATDVTSIDVEIAPFRSFVPRIKSGTLDAAFFLAAQPAGPIRSLLSDSADLLPLEGTVIDALRDRYPFLHPVVIPAGTYPRQETAIRTVGVESLLICRADVDAERVKRVTSEWFATVAVLAKEGRVSDAVNAALASATPIPLHPGAAQYHRAQQVQPR